ncbi:MAG: DUF2442 domain-containing protein [Polyangiaceae bacterium]
MIKIVRASYAEGRKILLEFSTGESGTLDLTDLVDRDAPMVAPLKDAEYFKTFFLELGALSWPNGFDLNPSAVYCDLRDRGELRPGRADSKEAERRLDQLATDLAGDETVSAVADLFAGRR